MLIETADHERVAQTIESEAANANLNIPNMPTAGVLEVCRAAGDFCFADDEEPRIICWGGERRTHRGGMGQGAWATGQRAVDGRGARHPGRAVA